MHSYRLIKCAFFVVMAMFAMARPFAAQAQQTITLVERPDSEFLILGLEINGFLRSEGIASYLPDDAPPDQILVPLRALSEAFSVSIEVDPASGEAQGFFLSEDRSFALDMRRKQAISAGEVFEIPEGGVEAHADDIYVKSYILEQWFDLDIAFQPNALILKIDSDFDFPFQAAEKRKEKANRLLTKSRRGDFDPQNAYLLPYKMLSLPTVLVQQSVTGTKSPDNRTMQSVSNIQAGFDVLQFGGDLTLTYARDNQDGGKISTARLTFSRSDPKQEMLGSIKAGRIDIGDVDFAAVPLFMGGRRGAGVAVSSEADFGFRFSQQLGKALLEGDAPVGWDVELYRNGQFIDFQTVEEEARFRFEEVQLINGFNRFQIIMFGPEGQKRTITRDIFSGPNMLPEGVVKYDAALGRPEADFLPLAENYRDDDRLGGGAQIFYGISDFLTVGGSVYAGPDDEDDALAGGVSVAASFAGLNMQWEGLRANEGRTGWRGALRRRFMGTNIALTHTRFSGFDPDDEDIEKSTELSLSRSFGGVNLTFLGEKQTLLDQEDRSILTSIVSSDIFGIRFTNELEKTFSKNEQVDDLEGEFSAFKEVLDTRVRTSLTYDLDSEAQHKLRVLRASAQRRMNDYDALRVGGNYDFPTGIASFDARYSHELDPVTLDFDVGGNTAQSYFAGVSVRTSLQPGKSGYEFVAPRVGTLASLQIRAFVDENGNQSFDPGEKPLENIAFLSTRSEARAKTDEDGIAWLYGLAETPTRIFVDNQEIPSIYIQPARKGLDLIPRRGTSSLVDYPFTQLGEIDGFVVSAVDGEPLVNIPVKVINVATGEEIAEMSSEYDGYFVFSALPLGEYKVVASYGWFEEGQLDTVTKPVILNVDEPIQLNQNLELAPAEEQETFGPFIEDVQPVDEIP